MNIFTYAKSLILQKDEAKIPTLTTHYIIRPLQGLYGFP